MQIKALLDVNSWSMIDPAMNRMCMRVKNHMAGRYINTDEENIILILGENVDFNFEEISKGACPLANRN